MSARDINYILGLWAASLAVHKNEPHIPTLKDFTILSTPPLLVMLPDNHLVYNIMELSPHAMFHLGCKQNTMSGFETPEVLSKICCQTLILNIILIMHPFKSTVLMKSIVSSLHVGYWAWQQAVNSPFFFLSDYYCYSIRTIIAEDSRTHGC